MVNMAVVHKICNSEILKNVNIFKSLWSLKSDCCKYSTSTVLKEKPKGRLKKERLSELTNISRYAQVYTDFLPDPNPKFRHLVREKLERKDMLARRKVVDIPEFYVGSIVAVTISDIHTPGKTNRFLGICIEKRSNGLRTNFTLRNAIDYQGIEINYNMYDPTIQKIECIRLEKRLDDVLYFLRDAPLEYSTFPQDMKPEYLPPNSKVPVNNLIVPLNPRPYTMKWELKELKGITNVEVGFKRQKRVIQNAKPWEKYDLMKMYRETIPDEEKLGIFYDVHKDLDQLEIIRRNKMRSELAKKKIK